MNEEKIKTLACEFSEEIVGLREAIHRHPEIGNNEYRTAELIERYLGGLGIATVRVLDTAVIGVLQCNRSAGKVNGDDVADKEHDVSSTSIVRSDTGISMMRGMSEGKTVAIRADMDALPVDEETGAAFVSEVPGVMHACGHDVHTAAALGAARILSEMRDGLDGNVIFLFEPDEEGRGGAARMIREGCMEGVDAVFGAHVSPDLPAGMIGVKYGKFYAASDMFKVAVTGRSSHGALREQGIDALAAAAEMITAVLALPKKITGEKCVLTVGMMNSGTAGNIMPGVAEFEGIIRTLGPDTRSAMEEAFRRTVSGIAERTGTEASIDYIHSYPGVVNNDEMTTLVLQTATAQFGKGSVCTIDEPTMTTEDFGYYLDEAPGAFYHIGAGCSEPLHSERFLPQNDVVVRLAEMHAALAAAYLAKI